MQVGIERASYEKGKKRKRGRNPQVVCSLGFQRPAFSPSIIVCIPTADLLCIVKSNLIWTES